MMYPGTAPKNPWIRPSSLFSKNL